MYSYIRLLSQLSSFTNQLFTNPHECGALKWTKPPVPTSYLLPKSHSSSSVAAAALQPLPPPTDSEQPVAGAATAAAAAAAKMYRSVKGVVRDPKTGKGGLIHKLNVMVSCDLCSPSGAEQLCSGGMAQSKGQT